MSGARELRHVAGETLMDALARFRRSHKPKTLESLGIDWSYYAAGTSDNAIVLLHGGGGAGDVFFAYIEELAADFRVIAPSLPPTVTTVDAAIAGLVAILDRENIGSAHVLGHSQGGFLALAFSHRFPTRLRSLIIASSALPSVRHDRLVTRDLAWLGLTPNFLLRPAMRWALSGLTRLGGNALDDEERRLLMSFVPFDDTRLLRRWARSSGLLQRDYHRREKDDRRWSGPVLL